MRQRGWGCGHRAAAQFQPVGARRAHLLIFHGKEAIQNLHFPHFFVTAVGPTQHSPGPRGSLWPDRSGTPLPAPSSHRGERFSMLPRGKLGPGTVWGEAPPPLNSVTLGFTPAAAAKIDRCRGRRRDVGSRILSIGLAGTTPRALLSSWARSGPRESLSVGFVGRPLSVRHGICPLSLGLNSLCYYLYVVGESGLAGEQEAQMPAGPAASLARDTCSSPLPGGRPAQRHREGGYAWGSGTVSFPLAGSSGGNH